MSGAWHLYARVCVCVCVCVCVSRDTPVADLKESSRYNEKVLRPGFNKNQHNVVVNLSSDGVQVFDDVSHSVWVVSGRYAYNSSIYTRRTIVRVHVDVCAH